MISVIMPVYRESPGTAEQAVRSVLAQTDTDIELIISPDDPENTALISFLAGLAGEDPRIMLLPADTHRGIAGNLNKALAEARGEFIARMDADDISYPDRLEKQLSYLEKNDLSLTGGLTDIIDETGRLTGTVDHLPENPVAVNKALRFGSCIPHPTWLARTKLFRVLDGYRDIPRAEDYDFLVRAALAGFRLGNLNNPVIRYRRTAGSESRSGLYHQFVTTREISAAYRKGRVIHTEDNPEMIRDGKITLGPAAMGTSTDPAAETKALRYAEAESIFYDALEYWQSGQRLKGASAMLRSVRRSPAFMDKTARLAAMYTIGRIK